jgi:electron transfer flavoprotein beta subunit
MKGYPMKIIVMIKQVPDTESVIEIDADGTSINSDEIRWVMNPYDELAVEEALQLREATGGSVTALTLGPDRADQVLRTALAMGADTAVRIDPQGRQLDGLAVAKALAGELQKEDFDLIIAGHRAVDDDNFQVGPAVAEFLNIAHISMVIHQQVADGKIRCTRTIDGGTLVLETALPALITTQRGLNEPRYASLPGIMKAKKKPIDTRPLSDTGTDPGEPMVKIAAMRLPTQRTAGRIIQADSAADQAAALVKALRKEAKVI